MISSKLWIKVIEMTQWAKTLAANSWTHVSGRRKLLKVLL